MRASRPLQAAALLALGLAAVAATVAVVIATAEPQPAQPPVAAQQAPIPQVLVIGKRLSAAEKARMAQEDAEPEQKKMLSKKTPPKTSQSSGVHDVG